MYNKIVLGAAAAALLMAGTAQAQTMVTATSDLNIRSGPGPHHPVVGVIAVDGQADLEGCLQASKWCRVSYNGAQGWVYSDYLIADYSGRDVVVAQRSAEVEVPVVEFEDKTGTGAAVGMTGGAVAGALIGGPIGAAVGAVSGATLGATTAIAIDPPPQTRTYVLENEVEPVYLEGEVVIGAGVPEPVRLYEIPNYEYRYAYVNGLPVFVEPEDRRIVYVVR